MKKKTDDISVRVTKACFDLAAKVQDDPKVYIPLTSSCPVAQAIRRLFPRKAVHVYPKTALIGSGNSSKEYVLDATAIKLIKRFDGRQRKELRDSLPLSIKLTQRPGSTP